MVHAKDTPANRAWRKANRDKVKASEDRYRNANPWRNQLISAKQRAKENGLEFTLTEADLGEYPTVCPVLGIAIDRSNRNTAASIDRIDNSKGYTPDNIVIVSYLANRIKNNATVEQLCKVAEFYKQLGDKQ